MNWLVFWIVFAVICICGVRILTSAAFWKLVGIIFLIWVLVSFFNWLFTPDVPVIHETYEMFINLI